MRLGALLAAIRQMLAEPNPDDPLDADAARLFSADRKAFDASVRAFVARQHAGEGEADKST